MLTRLSALYHRDPAGFELGVLRLVGSIAGATAIWFAVNVHALCTVLSGMGSSCWGIGQ